MKHIFFPLEVREHLPEKNRFLSGIARKGGGRALPKFVDPFFQFACNIVQFFFEEISIVQTYFLFRIPSVVVEVMVLSVAMLPHLQSEKKNKYTNTNTQIQKYTNSNTQTQIQLHNCNYCPTVRSWQECGSLCSLDPTCMFWSYVLEVGSCQFNMDCDMCLDGEVGFAISGKRGCVA